VLSTLLDAGDGDYRVVVISDCCADQDAELHQGLLTRLFPRRADIITADDFVKALQSAN
jgi:nicotinamidase-related amidase